MTEIRKNWHDNAFFGIHYDLHGHIDDLPGFCGKVDEEQLYRLWKEIKPDWVQCDGKGHPGFASWFCKTGWYTPELAKDDVRAYRNASKRLGIPLGIHYSGLRDGVAVRHNPDWHAVGSDGNKTRDCICLTSDYVEKLMIPQLLELIDDYDVDGFWIDGDNWGATPCWCDRCKKEFTRRTGITEIPTQNGDKYWHNYMDFFRDLFTEYVNKYTKAVHDRKPDCMVCSNWMYSVRQPEDVRANVDYLSGDFSPNYGADRAALEGRFLDARKMPWDLMAWGFTRSTHYVDWERTSLLMKTFVHLSQELAEAVALGGGTMVYLAPMRDGRVSEAEHRVVKRVANEFVHPRRQYCFKTQSASEVALLHLAGSYYAQNNPLYNLGSSHDGLEGALHIMQETHRSVDIISSEDTLKRLNDYKLIVLPEIVEITPEEKAAVLEFAANGGIVFGTGAYFANEFANELNIIPDGEAIAEPTYERVNMINHRRRTAVRFNDEGCDMICPVQPVKPQAGTEVLTNIYPTRDGECESGTVKPVATVARYGKGVIAGCFCPIFGLYSQTHYYLLRDLLDDMLCRIGYAPAVQLEAPEYLEMIERKRDNAHHINLINRSAVEVMNPRRIIATSLAPVNNIKIKVKDNGEFSRITVFPEDEGLSSKRIDSNTWEITLPKVDIHSVVMLNK